VPQGATLGRCTSAKGYPDWLRGVFRAARRAVLNQDALTVSRGGAASRSFTDVA
jgi:hypothetical protein